MYSGYVDIIQESYSCSHSSRPWPSISCPRTPWNGPSASGSSSGAGQAKREVEAKKAACREAKRATEAKQSAVAETRPVSRHGPQKLWWQACIWHCVSGRVPGLSYCLRAMSRVSLPFKVNLCSEDYGAGWLSASGHPPPCACAFFQFLL